jgi:hypothetical protein
MTTIPPLDGRIYTFALLITGYNIITFTCFSIAFIFGSVFNLSLLLPESASGLKGK